MHYYSHLDRNVTSTFSGALLANLAPDGGLWMPSALPLFSSDEREQLAQLSFPDFSAFLATHFVDENFDSEQLRTICASAYDFDLPIRSLKGDTLGQSENDDYILELFHGPTLAFKDFAARFMAACTASLLSQTTQQRTILVATSGDTGGAVGSAFQNQPGVRVIILYPKDGVSKIQEAQMLAIGTAENVSAIAVDGSFDECQALVKNAFLDKQFCLEFHLMSANSINVGRILPQSFYYFWTSLKAKATCPGRPLVYSIPSGNLGNLTGGLLAKKMGAPIDKFVVGHNINDPFVEFLATGVYRPRPSKPTLSNAMDIGRPNNFERILALFDGDLDSIRSVCWGKSFTDKVTAAHMKATFEKSGYILCPHSAIGHAAMQSYRSECVVESTNITVATAHPAKFAHDVEAKTGCTISLPPSLAQAVAANHKPTEISPTLPALRTQLMVGG